MSDSVTKLRPAAPEVSDPAQAVFNVLMGKYNSIADQILRARGLPPSQKGRLLRPGRELPI